jgi:hypothetical protein
MLVIRNAGSDVCFLIQYINFVWSDGEVFESLDIWRLRQP